MCEQTLQSGGSSEKRRPRLGEVRSGKLCGGRIMLNVEGRVEVRLENQRELPAKQGNFLPLPGKED